MNSHYTDIESTTNFDWIIIKQYRQVKPDSDKSTKELTNELEKKLAKASFITRLGNDIYYLYYFKDEKINTYL
ncbi:unnamed protein product [Rotaria sordida]|uniref:Uncharacterized protein n=1 Tax=Rotaria sordida TaxID=392033 RepID=A0A813YLW0_9BILA|nr:unnamed protein product [Rotaria sordida]CAF0965720.1 unnamed protein product [Rotaria sordida]CAF1101571.1 unnamed protein product [Rotaria sordida]CAF1306424.1 unnamed protein product [Rotaria sordida]